MVFKAAFSCAIPVAFDRRTVSDGEISVNIFTQFSENCKPRSGKFVGCSCLFRARRRVTRLVTTVLSVGTHANSTRAPLTGLSLPRVINFKFPLQPHQNITSHSMENLALHSLLRWNMIKLPIITTSLIRFLSKKLGNRMYFLKG